MDKVVAVAALGFLLGLTLAIVWDQWWLVPIVEVGFAGAALLWERRRTATQ